MEAKIRHQQYILFYSGLAVAAFGLWGALKIGITLTVHPVNWMEIFTEQIEDLEVPEIVVDLVSYGVIAFIILLDVSLRLYIGRSAIRDSAGQKKRFTYIFITVFALLFNTYSTLETIYQMVTGVYADSFEILPEQTITTTIIDSTSNVAFILIIISAIRVWIYRKKLRKKE